MTKIGENARLPPVGTALYCPLVELYDYYYKLKLRTNLLRSNGLDTPHLFMEIGL